MDGISGKSTIDFRNIGDLVAIEVGSSPGAIVAQHLIESSRDEQNFSELERVTLEKQLEQSQQAQIDSLHDEADAVRAAGLIRGVTQIGAGAAGLASALSSGEKAAEWTAAGQLSGALGSVFGAGFDASAKDAAADATSHGHAAQHLERRLKEIDERINDAQTQQQKAIDSAAQFVELEARTAQATLFLRG